MYPNHCQAVLQSFGSEALSQGLSIGARQQLTWWLGGTAAWVYSMVVLGGVTRLTRSGLSMTEWKLTGERPTRGGQIMYGHMTGPALIRLPQGPGVMPGSAICADDAVPIHRSAPVAQASAPP